MTIIDYMWHVAKYSVFGVKISVKQYPEPLEVIGVNVRNLEYETSSGIHIVPMDFSEVRLYLYPLSHLTGDDFIRYEAWSKPPIGGHESRERFLERMNNLEKLLCSRHIDYIGLIQIGMAVDATGKGIYGNME